MKTAAVSVLWLLLFWVYCEPASACRYTPLEWQQPVVKHSIRALIGQRKHTTWVRDRDRDFIDDEIRARFGADESIDIIVDLNQCIPVARLAQRFRYYGRVTFASRAVTFVLLAGVRVKLLPDLAAESEVAMIEWQPPGHLMTDVAARAMQARSSNSYASSARSRGLTGKGVKVAIVDSGVDDIYVDEVGTLRKHEAFPPGKFHKGFRGPMYEDGNLNDIDDSCEPAPRGDGNCTGPDDEPGLGDTNPTDYGSHGTHVAGIVLGVASSSEHCSVPTTAPDNTLSGNCEGVAPAAALIDVQAEGSIGELFEALDWIERSSNDIDFDVVNISMAFCVLDDDGTSALAQQVDALVSLGIVVVAAHGNASRCDFPQDRQVSLPPGSSSAAITVAASHDLDSVTRSDDVHYTNRLRGPRKDFTFISPNVAALKPDIAAPGVNVLAAQAKSTNLYSVAAGTSVATPFVAGAAAIILEARPTITPASLKDLLRRTADQQQNGEEFTDDPVYPGGWESRFGSGLLDLESALKLSETDVTFPTCTGPAATAGQPCALTAPLPTWKNNVDLTTASNPVVGVPNTIRADVRNAGTVDATVNVNFGVYVLAIGNRQFYPVGTVTVTIPAGGTLKVSQPWTPAAANHQCIEVTIDFGLDSNFLNNVTQRNVQVAPSVYEVQVENPFMTPARITLDARSERAGWECRLSERSFTLDSRNECPRKIRVEFDAPPGTPPGDYADCNISATATRRNEKPVPIGGITVQTFVPKPCRIVGTVVDADRMPVSGAMVTVRTAPRDPATTTRHEAAEPTVLRTDRDGIFDAVLTPHVRHVVTIAREGIGSGELTTRLQCGASQRRYILTRDGVSDVE